jgi:FdhD protein
MSRKNRSGTGEVCAVERLTGDAARPGTTTETRIVTVEDGRERAGFDRLATEEPLEIRLRAGGAMRSVAITMRTPGNDFELAAGFLYNEGVIGGLDAISGITYCVDPEIDADQRYNIVNVDLAGPAMPVLDTLERHFTMTSACGICGKAQLDALRDRGLPPITTDLRVTAAQICALPDRLRAVQRVFATTGGLHAAAAFAADGTVIVSREDVGRHNALDKLVGWALLQRRLPLRDTILLVSGRASYELVQKAVAAGIPFFCSVSAPSSLAVEVARAFGITLCGFVRGNRFNVYAGEDRIAR